jgi:hypothetical protein
MMESTSTAPLAADDPRELESGTAHFDPSSVDGRAVNSTSKWQDCTFRVIPLCATVLVIFSIGGGLAYAFNKQPLPRDAAVGVSITFLFLGLSFAIGCLKMYHDTHESHISRLDPALRVYEQVTRYPIKPSGRAPEEDGACQENGLDPVVAGFLQKPSEERQSTKSLTRTQKSIHGEPQLSVTSEVDLSADQISTQRRHSKEKRERHLVCHGPDKYRKTNTYLAQNAMMITHPNDHRPGRPISNRQPRTPQSEACSIRQTPPSMIGKQSHVNHAANDVGSVTHRLQQQPQQSYNYPSRNNEDSVGETETFRKLFHTGGPRNRWSPCYTNLQINSTCSPEPYDEELCCAMETRNTGELMYRIADLVGMPATRDGASNDRRPVLHRSSSKMKKSGRDLPGLPQADGSLTGPDISRNGQVALKPTAFVNSTVKQRAMDDQSAQLTSNQEAPETLWKEQYPKQDYGRSLTMPRHRLRSEADVESQTHDLHDPSIHGK